MAEEKNNPRLSGGATKWLAPLQRASKRWPVAILGGLFLLGLTIMLMTRTTPARQSKEPQTAALAQSMQEGTAGEVRRLETDLRALLAKIAGAGAVEVHLTLAAASGTQWEQNTRSTHRTVEDRTQDGGVQVTTEATEETALALRRQSDGSEEPVKTVVTSARVEGVVVVATGAGNRRVKSDLARAAATYLGIGLHRVLVLSGGGD